MRAAMLGGAGYMVGKKAAKGAQQEQEQEQRLDALEAQGAPAPAQAAAPAPAAAAPAAGGEDVVAKLQQLKSLLDSGALSQEEFDAAKTKLLGA
jgi:hypothetical protein